MPAPKGHKPYNKNGEGGLKSPYTKEIIEEYADKFKEWLKDESHVWLKDFALDNDFDPDFLSKWAKENERFAGAYKIAKHRQESRLVNGGLQNAYNSKIVSLLLSSCHGIRESKEERVSFDGSNPIPEWIANHAGKSKDLVSNESS